MSEAAAQAADQAAAAAAPPATPWPMASAEPELLERVAEQAGLSTRPALPGLRDYLGDLMQGFLAWMVSWLERLAPGAAGLFARLEHPLWGWLLGGLALLLALLLAARWLRRLRPQEEAPGVTRESPSSPGPAAADRDWEGLLEAHLSRGVVGEALEALWWWLAVRLRGAEVDPTWTIRELLAAAGRPDLGPAVGELDRMLYGGGQTRPAEVRGLWGRLRRQGPGGAEAA